MKINVGSEVVRDPMPYSCKNRYPRRTLGPSSSFPEISPLSNAFLYIKCNSYLDILV